MDASRSVSASFTPYRMCGERPLSPSSSSMASSSGSWTPILISPPALLGRTCIPLPTQLGTDTASGVIIHPTLATSSALIINYDLRNPPSTYAHSSAIACVTHESATMPPLPSMTLVIPKFPWPITVHATVSRGGRAIVTVGDVILSLYRALEQPAAEDVVRWGVLATNPSTRQTGARVEPRAQLRRLDYLNHKTTFVGLSPSRMGPDIMIVNVK